MNAPQKVPMREKRKVHQFKKRAGFNDTHHLKPKSRGGQDISSNSALLDAYRHDAWHLLFGNLTFDEVIVLLERFKNKKQAQKMFLKQA